MKQYQYVLCCKKQRVYVIQVHSVLIIVQYLFRLHAHGGRPHPCLECFDRLTAFMVAFEWALASLLPRWRFPDAAFRIVR